MVNDAPSANFRTYPIGARFPTTSIQNDLGGAHRRMLCFRSNNSRPPTMPPVKMECAASSESFNLAAILLDTDTRQRYAVKKSPDKDDDRVTRAKKAVEGLWVRA
ncbi:hypothetical protein JAAARDRAFT_509581 [Jaapia argillacea MUCL 33604]|uniref:Uncharacterized protein n=1 Tax=Jaapia argillacea MUCL 33604 TaxID=933084 RepID=A0A067QFS5_9AGAM|nr:hypothetical protein JAAARDRAFT_509581 [Jaapia argillacea MUCL 33604]